MNSNATAKTRRKPQVSAQEQAEFEAIMGTLGTVGAVPALIGLWSVACFVGGLVESGGPVTMAKYFFSAFTGI